MGTTPKRRANSAAVPAARIARSIAVSMPPVIKAPCSFVKGDFIAPPSVVPNNLGMGRKRGPTKPAARKRPGILWALVAERMKQPGQRIAKNADLARELSLTPQNINYWQKSGYVPAYMAARLAELFGETAEYWLTNSVRGSSHASHLTARERQIVDSFRQLSERDRDVVHSLIDLLLGRQLDLSRESQGGINEEQAVSQRIP